MRKFMVLVLFFGISMTIFSQKIEFGKYRLCYDIYWRCHFQNIIDLKTDSTYEFIYLDDTRMEKTQGKWKIDSNYMVLTPDIIPDTIKVIDVFEISDKGLINNKINISEWYKGIADLEITCFLNGIENKYITDSLGEIDYKGNVVDSLIFSIKGRELKIIPKKKETPSIIRISIDSDYKDLVYRQLGINKIMIQNGKMIVKYRNGENGELKTEYFEKIE